MRTLLLSLLLLCAGTAFSQTEERKVFTVVNTDPSFPGGSEALTKWVESFLRYPVLAEESNIQGKVIAAFWVEKDGSVRHGQILRSPHELLSQEVLRIIRFMPRWVPGRENGSAIRVRYTMPVNFRLLPPDDDKDKRKEE